VQKIITVAQYLDAFLHIGMKRNRYLVVNITNGTASLLPHAAISFSHADSVTIKSVTIQWKGNFSSVFHFSVFYSFTASAFIFRKVV
jgi:hypothetical protein